ncbi:MAG: T9SS type A sorting domain-containing protein [Patescibacteria group bacterium]
MGVTYWNPGTYQIELIVEDTVSHIQSTPFIVTIYVYPIPQTFTTTPSGNIYQNCNGNPVTVTANTAGGVNYLWRHNGNTVDTNATANLSGTGAYFVYATNIYGCRNSQGWYVYVNPNPALNISLGVNGNNNDTVSICNNPLNTNYAYVNWSSPISILPSFQWNDGSNGNNLAVTQSGNYWAILTDLNTGCSDTDSVYVYLHQLPVPVITSPMLEFCEGAGTVLLVATHYPSYSWSNSANTQSTYVNWGGVFTVTVTDTFGCTGTALSVQTIVWPNPVAEIETIDCEMAAGLITLGPGDSIQWSLNGIPIPQSNSQFLLATGTGFYTVTVTNSHGCTGTSLPMPMNCTETGVDLLAQMKGINVYPNPVVNQLTVKFANQNTKYKVQIVDMVGKSLAEAEGTDEVIIPRGNITPGYYIVKIRDSENSQEKTAQIIVQ